jgi:tetratricopeptide (TPR) repeat protein
VDCDTACFIYLQVAQQLDLPVRMVTIPAFNRKPGHAFVRWREGSHFLNWETMDGIVTTDDHYVKHWDIDSAEIKAGCALTDLSPDEVLGCEHYLLAIQFERLGDAEQALSELSTALALYPHNLDARREFAWATATSGDFRVLDHADAIGDALYVLSLVDDPDARDTLAAAYASAGRFDLAVKEEQAAIAKAARLGQAKPDYKERLRLYQQGIAYRQPKSAPTSERVLKTSPD